MNMDSAACWRVDLCAYGYEANIRVDQTRMRQALHAERVVRKAWQGTNPSQGIQAFAVMLMAMKKAHIRQEHLIEWISQTWEGQQALRNYATEKLGLTEVRT